MAFFDVGFKSGEKPRLLFLAYWFPPVHAVASLRTFNMVKRLSGKGWHITVVTPSPDCWRMVDNDGRLESLGSSGRVRIIVTDHRWFFLFPEYLKAWNRGLGYLLGGIARTVARKLDIERQVGWVKGAKEVCGTFQIGEFDLILASGGPFVSFQLAKDLSDRLGCPFVIDYRDLWNGNPHLHKPLRRRTVRREAEILEACSVATVVSPSLKSYLSGRFKCEDKMVELPNGFDAEELAAVKPLDFGHFAIVYTGIFYIPSSTATPIMGALRSLKESAAGMKSDWYFHYYGPQGEHVREEARKSGVLDRVKIHGMMERRTVLSAIRGANVAVVITSLNAEATIAEKGIVTGKIFEPLGLGTPVLLISPRDCDATGLVEGTGAGRQFHAGEVHGMASFLSGLMAEGKVTAKAPERYSWRHIAEDLEKTLLKVIEKKGNLDAR